MQSKDVYKTGKSKYLKNNDSMKGNKVVQTNPKKYVLIVNRSFKMFQFQVS